MIRSQWTAPTSNTIVSLRAGGRRAYNAERQREKWRRRFRVLKILALAGDLRRGDQARLAERLGVSRPVMSRDVKWARSSGLVGCGRALRCSYRRGWVCIEV